MRRRIPGIAVATEEVLQRNSAPKGIADYPIFNVDKPLVLS
jgi:hypothetical protein